MKVMVVDDSAIVRERLASMLAEHRPEIELIGEADDAPGAADWIRRSRPDVVILDIQLPGGSGIDVLEDIKKDASPPAVVMLTNCPSSQHRRRCEAAGADFFLDKSTEFDMLLDVLRQLARESRVKGSPGGSGPERAEGPTQ